MPLPAASEARPFYQAALQRFDDARFLLAGDRRTAAVYLAGYSVECMLKVLILSAEPAGGRADTLATFRGQRAHDYEWLRQEYLGRGGPRFPPEVVRDFARVNTWATALRYKPGTVPLREATEFINAANRIVLWAQSRM